jgi:hypothetical protein
VGVAERQHQAGDGDRQAGAERADVDELAARDHQRADGDERDRRHVRAPAECRDEPVRDRAADDASVPAQVEDAAEEEPERDEPEPPELGMVVRLRATGPGALLLADARGRLRAQLPCALAARHGPCVRRGLGRSF